MRWRGSSSGAGGVKAVKALRAVVGAMRSRVSYKGIVAFLRGGATSSAAIELGYFSSTSVGAVVASAGRAAKLGKISEGARSLAKKHGHAKAGGYESAFAGITPTKENAAALVRQILSHPTEVTVLDKVTDVYSGTQGVRIRHGSFDFDTFLEGSLK